MRARVRLAIDAALFWRSAPFKRTNTRACWRSHNLAMCADSYLAYAHTYTHKHCALGHMLLLAEMLRCAHTFLKLCAVCRACDMRGAARQLIDAFNLVFYEQFNAMHHTASGRARWLFGPSHVVARRLRDRGTGFGMRLFARVFCENLGTLEHEQKNIITTPGRETNYRFMYIKSH